MVQMALDHMAIISNGSYPTPTPTDAQRAYYAASHGLLGDVPAVDELESGIISRILEIGRKGINFAVGLLRIGG